MRKYKKQELINCIKTLKEAHKKAEYLDDSVRNEIFSQCQEMAIQVGMEIDRIEGEGTCAVSYLEEYCEEVYRMVVSTDTKGVLQKNAERLLDQIADSIIKEIPVSPAEIVFLPYKASMWDALDSVYRAAIEEKDCHVVVMPIPYFNIDSKGKVLAVEYEGNQFPDDIPITDFSKINLAQLHPDVIFIHNPYDEWNRVTRIPQEYFSATLVKYTEHLVYIPYFVTKGDKIKDDYCYLPAVRNAWRTFVQSDAVRDCYIKNGAEPSKIVAMGSPKFDMVIRMQENPPAMPEEWKAALAGRKVFLLNTHLNPIINEAEKMIDKLRQIFQLFAERDDAALLWRPHPLSIQTAKSMNPRILESYMQLVEEFETLQNGVYDTTPDVHRAIAISDAYIGHGSSLVPMYGITGRPIYILDMSKCVNVRENEIDQAVSFATGVAVDGYLWTSAENENGIYRIDLVTGNAEWMTCFLSEGITEKNLYRKVVRFGEFLFFVPWRAKHIIRYSLLTGEQKILKTKYNEKFGDPKFSEVMVFNNCLYLFPARLPGIVCLDMNTLEMTYDEEISIILQRITDKYAIFFNGIRQENMALVVSRKGNYVVSYDMLTNKGCLIQIDESSSELVDIASGNGSLYFLNALGEVIRWNQEKKGEIIWKYRLQDTNTPFSRMEYIDGFLWLFPGEESYFVKIDVNCGEKEEKIDLPQTYQLLANSHLKAKARDYMINGNELIVYPMQSDSILQINTKTMDITIKKITRLETIASRCERYLSKCQERELEANRYVYNEYMFPVETFTNIVVMKKDIFVNKRREKYSGLSCNVYKECGKKIWEYVYGYIK